MLKEWKLANFKAVANKTTLQLAPLTILVGENSSGKSSILQSILILSQTLRATSSRQPIVLNGEFTRLGYMSDVVHDGLEKIPLEIGFTLQTNNPSRDNAKSLIQLDMAIQIHTIDNQDSQEGLLSSLTIKDLQTPNDFIMVERTFPKTESLLDLDEYPQINISPELKNEMSNGVFDYTITNMSASTGKLPTSIYPFQLHNSFYHFLPSKILETYDAVTYSFIITLELAAEFLRNKAPQEITSFETNVKPPLNVTIFTTPHGSGMQREILNALNTALPSKGTDPRYGSAHGAVRVSEEYIKNSSTLFEWLNMLKSKFEIRETRTIGDRLLYRASLLRGRQDKDTFFEYIGARAVDLPSSLLSLTNQITDYFAHQVYYLGPLREDPRFIYSLPPYPEVTHVGLKGEFTASVLEKHKSKKIIYPRPPQVNKSVIETGEATLIQALREWLEYMGLLGAVTTKDRGKMGTELSVNSIGVKRELDLTSIGVGVSQVLPTLVMGLIAPAGTTFLLEQPELHLHPKVQSMVADFLLGLTKVGKQCIVETHSEYLVSRLRRRIAEDENNKLVEQASIYFVERKNGKSSFRKLDLNQYGALLSWPDGFFDEGPNESELILKAALKKRKQSN